MINNFTIFINLKITFNEVEPNMQMQYHHQKIFMACMPYVKEPSNFVAYLRNTPSKNILNEANEIDHNDIAESTFSNQEPSNTIYERKKQNTIFLFKAKKKEFRKPILQDLSQL